MNTELRADRRRRTRNRESSAFSWTLVVGFSLLTALAILQWAKSEDRRQIKKAQIEADERSRVAEIEQLESEARQIALRRRQEEAEQHRLALYRQQSPYAGVRDEQMREYKPRGDFVDSGRTTGPSARENLDAALRSLNQGKNEYRKPPPPPNIVSSARTFDPAGCEALRDERDSIEAQQRRGYYRDQHYDNRLRQIWTAMTQLNCDMGRYAQR